MHQALERGSIKRGAKRFLAVVRRTIKLHGHDFLARVRMRLDLVAIPVPVDNRFRHQLQVVGAGNLVAAGANCEPIIEFDADRSLDLLRGQHGGNRSPCGAQFRVDLFDVVAIEAQGHSRSRSGDGIISFGGDTADQIPVEISGKEIPEENMREGKREMIGSLDAGNRLRDELVGCIRSG